MRSFFFLCLFTASFACTKSSPSAGQQSDAPEVSTEQPALSEENIEEVPLAARNVLYYYKNLEPPYATEYPLVETKGKWKAISPSNDEILLEDVVVDLKNGYIEITDPGTGGGEWTTRCVLFRMANGTPVLGLSRTFFDGATILQDLYFLRPEDPQKLDWTTYTMPAVDGFNFLRDDSAEEEAIVKKLLPVTIELPRQGTSVKAWVYTGLKELYCRGDENEYSDYCGLFQQVRRTEITFKWNREKGKFER